MIYNFPHLSDREFPIQPKMLGIGHEQEPINRPKGLHLYQWFYCEKGRGEFISDHQRSVISEGQGLLIYPEIPHIYQGISSDWTVDFIGFDGSLCLELLQGLEMRDSGVYHFSEPKIFTDHIQLLNHLRRTTYPRRCQELSTACYRFLLDLSETITHINPSELVQENDLIRKILSYLEENFAQCIALRDLSELVQLSEEYLCSIFKKAIGQSIMHYLKMLRINHARIYLVQYPEKKIREISKMCGFESPSYFGKVFKEETGLTPEVYRKLS